MFKKIVVLFILVSLFSVTILGSSNVATSPVIAFCEHRGYKFQGLTENKGWCIFNDGKYCDANSFFNEECGEEYRIDIGCRKKGESVFLSFEECCEGLIAIPADYVLGQTTCKRNGFLTNFFRSLRKFF